MCCFLCLNAPWEGGGSCDGCAAEFIAYLDFLLVLTHNRGMEASEGQFKGNDQRPEVKYRYTPGHPSQHQMGAYTKVDTDLGNGTMFPVTTRVGELSWSKKTGRAKIAVQPDYQRQGIGSELWKQATRYAAGGGHVPPSAAKSTTRTDAGDNFLKKVDPNAGNRKHKAEDSFGDFFNGW